jgi:A/G-specific adenine glycosylase
MSSTNSKKVLSFRREVWNYYKKHGRSRLPWRKTKDPYKILVSEVMLQQTQVPRVIEKYKEFLKAFPTVKKLAKAPLSDVLSVWSGMGYNRRAKYLRDMAKVVIEKHNGRIPEEVADLRSLPGIGSYTASAVRIFSFNEPDILIETNIRAAYIHHFYSNVLKNTRITDIELLKLAQKAALGQDPREWHWALMDYGSHIKKLHKNPARKSAHYVRQSKFEGSLRQVRGAILRALSSGPKNEAAIYILIRANKHIVKSNLEDALGSLERDDLIKKEKGKWRIA